MRTPLTEGATGFAFMASEAFAVGAERLGTCFSSLCG